MQVIRLAVIISAKTNLKGMAVKKTLSRKQRFFNKINLTTDDEVYCAKALCFLGNECHSENGPCWLGGQYLDEAVVGLCESLYQRKA